MTEHNSNLIVKDTSWSKITKFLIVLTTGLIFMNIFFPILFSNDIKDQDDLILFIQLMMTANVFFLFLYSFSIVFITPIQKTTIFISEEEVKIYLFEKLYFQINLNDTVKLELIKVGWVLSQLGYTINFEGSYFTKKIRLSLFIFTTKKQKLVVNCLKQISKKLNIKCEEFKNLFDNYEELKNDKLKVKNFVRNIKKDHNIH